MPSAAGSRRSPRPGSSIPRNRRNQGPRLAGATVAVAGGTAGMGRAAAECFAADGARVAVLARSQAALTETVAELRSLGSPDAIGLPTDLSRPDPVTAAFDELGGRWGGAGAGSTSW